MTRKTFLLIDTNNLAYRVFHALGTLSFNQIPTEVTFGLMRYIDKLSERFGTDNLIFCFDSRNPYRIQELPTYKESRRRRRADAPEEEKQQRAGLIKQLRDFRRDVLYDLGYVNVCFDAGFEADDLLAAVKKKLPPEDEKIIISSDQDLWQLLDSNTIIWNPHNEKIFTQAVLKEKYNIDPARWATVKAIAGCSSDDVPGVKGVGEKTAIKFLNNELGKKTKAFKAITEWVASEEFLLSLRLVTLPYRREDLRDTMLHFEHYDNELSTKKWNQVCTDFGLKSLWKGKGKPKNG